jgi:hypothetical protein
MEEHFLSGASSSRLRGNVDRGCGMLCRLLQKDGEISLGDRPQSWDFQRTLISDLRKVSPPTEGLFLLFSRHGHRLVATATMQRTRKHSESEGAPRVERGRWPCTSSPILNWLISEVSSSTSATPFLRELFNVFQVQPKGWVVFLGQL